MKPEAVVFDVGRVLISWDPEGFYDKAIGRERRGQLFAEVDLLGTNAAMDLGAPWRTSLQVLAERHPDWTDEIMLWHDRWIEITRPAIDHSVRLLRALRRRDVPVLALTNFGVETFAHARTHYDFLNEFDEVVVSGEVGTTKPDPLIYTRLEHRAGIAGDRLLFTDDLPANIETAAARGWRTHLFTRPDRWAARLVAEGLLAEHEAS